jgi:hypothetical protein
MRVLFACLISLAFLSGCYYDSRENLYPEINQTCTDTINVTYSGTVATILNNRCVSCHKGSSASGNVKLDSYASVMIVVNNKKLIGSIKQDGTAIAMPQGGGKLDDCKISAISKWVDAGAPNN